MRGKDMVGFLCHLKVLIQFYSGSSLRESLRCNRRFRFDFYVN